MCVVCGPEQESVKTDLTSVFRLLTVAMLGKNGR